ncbi:MAG TPA: MBL fold metallo-hydrolase [Cyclobacteriaceae bacterium]|nr:MBL fold metallo-hydrolase [Cyclobacteriaceae bacterium]
MLKILSIACTLIISTLSPASGQTRTKLILLGTGTPNADINKFGPSTAIVVDDQPYIIDCGPGVVRRAVAAGIDVKKLNFLFVTHLHSDHTSGYPDFLLTPAVLERPGALNVFGPEGIQSMNDHILKAYEKDLAIRINGDEHGSADAFKTNIVTVKPGVIFQDSRIKVTALKVNHGSWDEAYGYKFETPDKTIVVSGDCTFSESIISACQNCDILVHEVFSEEGLSKRSAQWQNYHTKFHTSTSQLAEIANRSKPKLVVLTHELVWSSTPEKLLGEIRSKYSGKVIFGNDLDVF